MDSVRNLPVKIHRVNQCDDRQISEDSTLLELQQFWSQEILHRQQYEAKHQLSSSLEKRFLYDDFLTNPVPAVTEEKRQKKVARQDDGDEQQIRVVRGEELNDVPTTYLISGLQSHEMPVIGTYVDKAILPGFRYKVRLNKTNKYNFGGRALRLLSVGTGYGKRLTFDGNSSLRNNNFFWSDNNPEGYGFALEVVSEGDRFCICDPIEGLSKAFVQLLRFPQPQRELKTTVMKDGSVLKTVQLNMICHNLNYNVHKKISVEGVAAVLKPKGQNEIAQVKSVSILKGSFQGMEMLPMEI